MYRLIGSVHTLAGLPGSIADFLRAMDSVRKSIGTAAGLSANELRTMAGIAEEHGITPKQLATNLELTPGAITAITNGLVERGLITRSAQAHDRRSLLLSLTDSGHELMEATYERFQAALASASSGLAGGDEELLVRALGTLTASLRSDND